MLDTQFLDKEINILETQGLRRHLRSVSGAQGPRLCIDGRQMLNFCSNNYLGLANDPRLQTAAQEVLKKYGFGSGASRLISGNTTIHEQLEKKIAQFKGAEAALLFNSGYTANVGIISSLFDRNDIIFSDRLNHASIIDGIILSQAKFKRYPHNDMAALEEMLKVSMDNVKKRCIITDSVFSMDGDIAPLDKIVTLAKKYNCWVMIDDAHALGVMGKNGKGLAEHFGVDKEIDIQMGTLSKAVGSFGAYCCGSQKLIDFLLNKARSFIYTTSLPSSVAAASLRAFEIVEEEPRLREKLWSNTQYMQTQLKNLGFDLLNSQTPIIPILVKDSDLAVKFSKQLFEAGIFISAIRPPTVPVNTARLRLTIMASHTQEDLDEALTQLKIIGNKLGVI